MDKDKLKEYRLKNLAPHQWKPGQSGNPSGRPKGQTLKEWMREGIMKMTDDERQEFLKGMPKDIIWRMAEGNPAQDLTSGGEKIKAVPIYGGNSIKDNDGESSGESSEDKS